MSTKSTNVGIDRGIYSSPFDAFTNYMNILGDFINRVNNLYPEEIDNDELNSLLTTIRNQGEEIEMKEKEISRLQVKIEEYETEQIESSSKSISRKPSTRKSAPKKKSTTKESSSKK